ncbi:MAG: hypothetical protein MJZ25_01645 [Fibrobacter sp.]|nr:hypothetical protein [Fibrobacter sp.]
MKLQQAYISEAVAIGNWQIIGYKGPGDNTTGNATGGASSTTTNFTYADKASGYTNNTVALSSDAVEGFAVTSNVKLNDCTAAKHWYVTVAKSTGSEGEAAFEAVTDCAELTPNFSKIGK